MTELFTGVNTSHSSRGICVFFDNIVIEKFSQRTRMIIRDIKAMKFSPTRTRRVLTGILFNNKSSLKIYNYCNF